MRSIRQHTSAYVSMRGVEPEFAEVALQHAQQTSAFVSIRQHVSICQEVAEVALEGAEHQ